MAGLRQRFTRRSGQSMVEFALLAPAFFLLLMGVLDFGRVGFYYVSAIDLAKQTARYAAAYDNGTGFTNSQINTYITTQSNATAMGAPTYVDYTVCARPNGPPSLACQKPGTGQTYYWVKKCIAPTCNPETVTVTVVYAFKPTTLLVSDVTGTIYLWSDSVMNKEYNG